MYSCYFNLGCSVVVVPLTTCSDCAQMHCLVFIVLCGCWIPVCTWHSPAGTKNETSDLEIVTIDAVISFVEELTPHFIWSRGWFFWRSHRNTDTSHFAASVWLVIKTLPVCHHDVTRWLGLDLRASFISGLLTHMQIMLLLTHRDKPSCGTCVLEPWCTEIQMSCRVTRGQAWPHPGQYHLTPTCLFFSFACFLGRQFKWHSFLNRSALKSQWASWGTQLLCSLF